MVEAGEGPVLHTQLWPLPPASCTDVVLPEPEPELPAKSNAIWRLDAELAPVNPAPAMAGISIAPRVTEQIWPLAPRPQGHPLQDLDTVSSTIAPDATLGSVSSQAFDAWLDRSNSAVFNETRAPPRRRSSGPLQAQTPDMGPPRTSVLSMLQSVDYLRPANQAGAAELGEQDERPWTSERFEALSGDRTVQAVGNTTGSLQMSVPLEHELRRSALDFVSRKMVRRQAAVRKRLGSRSRQSTAPQRASGVAFGSTAGTMRWTAQRSSDSRGDTSFSSGSAGIASSSPRRAGTPNGSLAGSSSTIPGPSAGWFLPLSPQGDDDRQPDRVGLRSRSSIGSSTTMERDLHGKRPVLIQASEPQLSGRTGRQSPRHGASVRYVKSPRERRQQGSGRDPTRSHLCGKGVGEVSRYRVLDKVIEVHAGPAPETPALPPADGTSIEAIQHGLKKPSSIAPLVAGQSGANNEEATDTVTQEPEWQRQQPSRARTLGTTVSRVTLRPRRYQQRRHLGQRPLPGDGQFAPGAVILDDFRNMSSRPVMVQLAQRKHKVV